MLQRRGATAHLLKDEVQHEQEGEHHVYDASQ